MNMRDAALVDRFLEMMAAEAGAAGNTLAAYRSDLRLAAEAMDGLADADEAALRGLAEGWTSLANATVARKAAALRRFYAFLLEEGLRRDDPASVLPRPGQRRALPKILSHADIDRLFAAIAERTGVAHTRANDLRLAALVELLYGSGLRASELVALPATPSIPIGPS